MEMKPVCLLLVFGVTAIRSVEINLNQLVDKNIHRVEDVIRKMNGLSRGLDIGGISMSEYKYSFPRAIVLGLDILRRTGDCKLIREGKISTYELHFGSGFLVVVIPRLTYKGEEMSAVLRVRNNSLYFSFNQLEREMRNITVNDVIIKSLGQVEFLSSNPQYEGDDVEQIFENFRMQFNGLFMNEKKITNSMAGDLWYMFSSTYPEGLFDELKTM
nr:uncharacterized protein LOC106678560 [Halyomorpha halys]